uniref:Uncharacterized protein n=1 Tax=Anguilla anguilla TaxID=7936 RepID=A0A0E9VY53_ANGAN
MFSKSTNQESNKTYRFLKNQISLSQIHTSYPGVKIRLLL